MQMFYDEVNGIGQFSDTFAEIRMVHLSISSHEDDDPMNS